MTSFGNLRDLFPQNEEKVKESPIENKSPPLLTKSALFIALHNHPIYHLVNNYNGYSCCGWWTIRGSGIKDEERKISACQSKSNLNEPIHTSQNLELRVWDPISKKFNYHEWEDLMRGCEFMEYRNIKDGYLDMLLPNNTNVTSLDPLKLILNSSWHQKIEGLEVAVQYETHFNYDDDKIWNIEKKDISEWDRIRKDYSEIRNNKIEDILTEKIIELYDMLSNFFVLDDNNYYTMKLFSSEISLLLSEINNTTHLFIPFFTKIDIIIPINTTWNLKIEEDFILVKSTKWYDNWNNFIRYWNILNKDQKGSWDYFIYLLDQLLETLNIEKDSMKNKINIFNELIIEWHIEPIPSIRKGLNKCEDMWNKLLLDIGKGYVIWNLSQIRNMFSDLGLKFYINDYPLKQKSYTILLYNDLIYRFENTRTLNTKLIIPNQLFYLDNEDNLCDYLRRLLNSSDIDKLLQRLDNVSDNEQEKLMKEALNRIKYK